MGSKAGQRLIRLFGMVFAMLCWTVHAGAQQAHLHNYGQADGLANLSVPCLLQDKGGILWVCTENGLARFDGSRLETLGADAGLLHSRFFAIAEDAGGSIWLGARRELYVQSGQAFTPLRYHRQPLSIDVGSQLAALPGGGMLIISDGQLYRAGAALGGGARRIERYFGAAAIAANPNLGSLTAVHVDRTGAIWIGCGTRICRLKGTSMQTFAAAQGVPPEPWLAFLVDRGGRTWARSFGHFIVMPPGQDRFVPAGAPDPRLTTAAPFVSIVEDATGHILTRSDAGIIRWTPGSPPGAGWELFGRANGLPSTYPLSLLVDREGTLWIGLGGGGLARWTGYRDWRGWTSAQGLGSDTIWAIARRSDGRLMVGTSSGCSMLNGGGGRFVPCRFSGQPPTGEINAIVETRDRSMWLSSMAGAITRVDAGGRARQIAMLPYVRTMWRDAADMLWIMTYHGVYRIAPGTSVPLRAAIPGAEEADFSDAAEDDEGIHWFASVKGLFQYVQGRWRGADLPHPGRFRSVAIGRPGELWASSTDRGLLHAYYDRSGIRRSHWINEPMVAGAAIATVRSDPQGQVWLMTDQGLILFDGRRWRRFSEADGLIWNDMNEAAWLFDRDGSIWAGTSNGLVQIPQPDRLVRTQMLDARIEQAFLGDRRLEPGEDVDEPWRKNMALVVKFALRDFSEAEHAHYLYRLIGLETGWTATSVPEARYSSLPPGNYRFQMRAFQPEHGRASAILSTTFDILPPWWQTIWFRLAVLIAAVLLIWSLMRFRERRLRRWQRVLEHDLAERETLLQRATRDSLTGLWNRATILDRLAGAIPDAPQAGLAVAMVDIDNFKTVNDTLGHPVGDAVLRSIAQELVRNVRSTDHVGRYGGEELLLILPGLPEAQPCDAIDKLCRAVRAADLTAISAGLQITVSIGVAWWQAGESPEQLIARADVALYRAKAGGRDRIAYAAVTVGAAEVADMEAG